MTDGEVVFCGVWPDGHHAIVQKCVDSKLGITFYIRYLHGINNEDLLNKTVSKGTQLGTVSTDQGRYDPHLHIDFSLESNEYFGIKGVLDRNNSTWTYEGNTYNLFNKIDYNIINRWEQEGGESDSSIGYLWLMFAQTPQYLTPSTYGMYNEVMDMSSKLSDDDWNALYGLLAYEESVLFNDFDSNETYRAILEWVIRVFRNRLFAGISVQSICKWNSGEPGYEACLAKASSTPDNIRNFAKDIISGRDSFLVEKYAKKYKYGDWPDEKHWYDRLYSADTFYGGSSPRQGFSALAAIPFSQGPYFYYEGAFTEQVQAKFWPNGVSGESAYPNPYRLSDNTSVSVLSAAKAITTLHYQNAITHGFKLDGTTAQYYSNSLYLDTTYQGMTVHSRRDCSGLVCGMWQILGDSSQDLTTMTFEANHPSNWKLISLQGLTPSDLRSGDVIFRPGPDETHSDGHTEIIKSISGNTIYTYGFGSDQGLAQSYNNKKVLDALNNYRYILRRQ